ncbi:uncharacterized protein LOC130748390 [Lotus japonicus]|uniref:uncharacterized protein LOC130748390 n=1 Tax=Lotus japonicus TaxID=34305 RepID=UPI00258A5BFB|nr:uncharacterized protein LOC130748390 [Lotus japonicus]
MGNCVRKNQISAAQDENEEGTKVEQIMKASSSSPKLEKARRKESKKVRFNVQDQDHRRCKGSGNMRIKLVVTKEELKRMLRNENGNDAPQTSLAQLLSDMKLREKSVSKIEENDGGLNSWRPALESIPEDQSFKI